MESRDGGEGGADGAAASIPVSKTGDLGSSPSQPATSGDVAPPPGETGTELTGESLFHALTQRFTKVLR